jgi:hypothetical protein
MTKLLEKAFAEAAKLPAEEQDALPLPCCPRSRQSAGGTACSSESEDLLGELCRGSPR